MITIRLFCANGFSTTMMCKKIEAAAKAEGTEVDVKAFPYSECKDKGAIADIILLGPQIRYNLRKVEAMYPSKIVILLDALTYGQMDGEKVFKMVKEKLKEGACE